jgi:tetratricopeptide (TPR) repeat protein
MGVQGMRKLAVWAVAAGALAAAGGAYGDFRDGRGRRAFDAGVVMVKRGQWVEAVKPFSEALAEDPQFAEAYLLRGLGLVIGKNYGAAGEDFTAYIVLHPRQAGGYMQRGVARLGQGRAEEAEQDFRRGADLGARPVNVQRGMGDAYMAEKKYREALAAYSEGIRLAPQSPTLYQRRALAYQALGDQRSAQADAAQSDALVRSGRALEPNDDVSELLAQAFAGTAGGGVPVPAPGPVVVTPAQPGPVVVVPGQPLPRGRDPRQEAADAASAATGLAQRGDLAGAMRQMDVAVGRDPTVANYWTMRGAFTVQLGQADVAATSYEKALTLDANDADAMLGLAIAYGQQRKAREARVQLERGLLIARRPQVQGALVMVQGALSADLNSNILREIMLRLQQGMSAARY